MLIAVIRDPEPFDWYQRYSGIRDLINQVCAFFSMDELLILYFLQYVKRDDVILMAGCGNSRLTEDMFEDGMCFIKPINCC